MRGALTIVVILFGLYVHAQSYMVSVNNGYGSGIFDEGDTVHIWAKEMKQNTVFTHWSGDSAILDQALEWHTFFTMPNYNVSLEANYDLLPSGASIVAEQIQGADTTKPVLYYFPQNPVGLVFLFHGTAGNMNIWIEGADNREMTKELMYQNFAVIITEAEEVTRHIDIDNDGKLRWLTDDIYILPKNNIDIRNIKALIDTFEERGWISPDIDKFAIGMSNGAIFSGTVSNGLAFKAAVPYCAGGVLAVYANTSTATQWCMAKYDDNPNVGLKGYNNALALSDLLDSLGVCTKETFLNDRSPIYPEVFMRTNYLTYNQSLAIYNELGSSGFFDTINGYTYMNIFSDTLFKSIVDSSFPVLYSLKTGNQTVLGAVRAVMDVTHAGHKFYADHNKRTIDFLLNRCKGTTDVLALVKKDNPFEVFPNPASNYLLIESRDVSDYEMIISDMSGKVLFAGENGDILDISFLEAGIFILKIISKDGIYGYKFLKD